ncbi:MAG: hypothetical protein ACRERU_19980 [Methylococcales bacterium]
MSQAFISPEDFAKQVAEKGLWTSGGHVKLNKYMSASESNGGSYTSQDLLAQIGDITGIAGSSAGRTPRSMCKNYVRVGMGQGEVQDHINVWSWMFDNLDLVRKFKIQTYLKDNPAAGQIKVKSGILDLGEVFKPHIPFPKAMETLLDKGCFGWDCIGFVSNYLIRIGHFTEYQTWKSHQYHSHGNFQPIKALDMISPCCVLTFGEAHIVLVSQVDYVEIDEAGKTLSAKVTISQSYTGGPHTRKDRMLTQSSIGNGFWGEINQTGVIDIKSKCKVGKHPDIEIRYPPYVVAEPVPDFVPGVF